MKRGIFNGNKVIAEVTKYRRKSALRDVYRTAKLYGAPAANHELAGLMFAGAISTSAYKSINALIKRQAANGWF